MANLSVDDKDLIVDFSDNLDICCIKSLKEINNALRGNISPPVPIPDHFKLLRMIFSFSDKDFSTFAEAPSLPSLTVYRGEWSKLDMILIGKRKDKIAECRKRADFELSKYHKSGKLYGLWATMVNRFDAAQHK
jgi:hypothetical protein